MTDPDPLAVAVMVAYCGWDPTWAVTDQVVTLDGNGTFTLFLPSLYVTAVTAVVVTNDDGSIYTATIGPGLHDVGWSGNGVLTWQSNNNGARWPLAPQSVAVTYSGGYDGPPDDLMAALLSITNRLPKMGLTAQAAGPFSESYAQTVAQGSLLLVEQMVFDRYRLPRAA